MNVDNISFCELNTLFSTLLIKNDVETLFFLGKEIKSSPIISLGIMPYYALFCHEYEKFLLNNNIEAHIQNKSKIRIANQRNAQKLFNEKLGKRSSPKCGVKL